MHNCRNNNRCKFAKIHNITFYFLFTFDKTILQLSCCTNTYYLGCVDSCAMVTLPIVFPTDGHYTLYFSGTNNVKITVSGVSGEPILLDATLLNANSIYTFYIQNTSGVRQLFEIGEVEYDCFKIKIDAYFSIDATEDITPTQPCTLMCQETYDPTGVGADAFNYNNLHTKAVSDGTTITGDGTAGNPFVAIGGGLTCGDLAICPIIISMANDIANKSDIGHTHTFASLTSKPTTLTGYGITDAYPLVGNPSAFIDATALLPYLTIASASATYQPILVSGTNIKTINGSSVLGAGDLTISGLPPQSGNNGKYLQTDGTNASWQNVSANVPINTILSATGTNTINNANYGQEWQWNSLTSGTGLKLSSTSTSATTGNTLLELNSSGTIGNSVSSYGLKVANSKVSPSGINYGIDINVGGSSGNIGLNITATSGPTRTGINLVAGMVEGIQMNNNTLYFSSTNTQYISHTAGDINFEAGTKQLYFRNTGTTGRWCWFGNSMSYNNYTTLNRHTSNGTMLIFGGEWDGTTTISNTATPSLIKASSGGLTFSSNSGASTTWGSFTPNNQMTIYNVNNNVGIGTTTPVASAILDLTSTTKGFAPPEMTATQASAISTTSRKLIIYVTDTNGTFTSAGLWMWNGTTWKIILAE
jgi:hypothetical protein